MISESENPTILRTSLVHASLSRYPIGPNTTRLSLVLETASAKERQAEGCDSWWQEGRQASILQSLSPLSQSSSTSRMRMGAAASDVDDDNEGGGLGPTLCQWPRGTACIVKKGLQQASVYSWNLLASPWKFLRQWSSAGITSMK